MDCTASIFENMNAGMGLAILAADVQRFDRPIVSTMAWLRKTHLRRGHGAERNDKLLGAGALRRIHA